MYLNGQFKNAKIGRSITAQQNNTIRTDEIFWIDEGSDDQALNAYLKQTEYLAKILNQSLFLGLVEFETHFAAYREDFIRNTLISSLQQNPGKYPVSIISMMTGRKNSAEN